MRSAIRILTRSAGALLVFVMVSYCLIVGGANRATADTTYYPPSGTWNGYVIYVSRACHDGGDGVPGGPCITNHGCNNYSENAGSSVISTRAATITTGGLNQGPGLTARGYRAIVGNGTVTQNIQHSNAAGTDIHIPVHSNAQGGGNCGGSSSPSNNGTVGLYRGYPGCAAQLAARVGNASPGTNDHAVYRSNLAELNSTNAIGCYLEAEFHTWLTGAKWLSSSYQWAYRVGAAVDHYLGYP